MVFRINNVYFGSLIKSIINFPIKFDNLIGINIVSVVYMEYRLINNYYYTLFNTISRYSLIAEILFKSIKFDL